MSNKPKVLSIEKFYSPGENNLPDPYPTLEKVKFSDSSRLGFVVSHKEGEI